MAAYTVQDAGVLQATELKLVHKKLCGLPAGLGSLQHLRSLDASDNPQLKDLQDQQLPPGITALTLAGCSLSQVTQCLSRLSGLSELQLAANDITQADTVFACPRLLHAGLSFNRISSINTRGLAAANLANIGSCTASTASASGLAAVARQSRGSTPVPQCNTAAGSRTGGSSSPQPTSALRSCKSSVVTTRTTTQTNACRINPSSSSGSSPASTAACSGCSSPLMSLDLSHNDITELSAVLKQLQQLPALRSLSLKGNPASLAAGYKEAVLQALPQLLYFDGQKIDGISVSAPGSRPGTTGRRPRSAKPAAAAATAAAAAAAEDQAAESSSMAAGAQSFLATASSMLGCAAACERTVPLLLQLQLGRQQLTGISEQAFALISAESARRQQQLLQEAAAVAENCSSDGSTGGNKAACDGNHILMVQSAAKDFAKHTSNSAPLPDAQSAAASLSSKDAAFPAAAAPLEPIAYHVEVQGPDGAQMCSTALVMQPPAMAGADAAAAPAAAMSADSKKGSAKGKPTSQDSKGAGAAIAKLRPGSPVKAAAGKARAAADEGAAAAAAGTASQQLQGGLQVLLQLPLSVAGRDYLRRGFSVKLVSTHQEPRAMLQPPPAAAAPAGAAQAAGAASSAGKRAPSAKAATGASGKPGKETAAAAAPVAAPCEAAAWQYEMKQQVLGTAQLAAADLLECCGEQQASEGSVHFLPPAPLFSTATGTLLPLKEASRNLKPIGSCSYKLVLHHQAPAD
ncbi:hypothetical protein COO60DRAFT_899706 [Scenedesmus sp. NREL 46B-D3]|nr:hypothetical protein COO60DRAFT_899706 [Scenedesmus sp. NREL 46B-D3]